MTTTTATGLPIRVTAAFLQLQFEYILQEIRDGLDKEDPPTPIQDAAVRVHILWKGDLRAATLDAEELAFESTDPHALRVAAILREAYESTLPA